MASRNERKRKGGSTGPPVSTWSELLSRDSNAVVETTLERAAASSIARGSPSSRRQISPMAFRFTSESSRSGRTNRARVINSAIAGLIFPSPIAPSANLTALDSGAIRYSNSPEIWRGMRLVMSNESCGVTPNNRERNNPAEMTCSMLSIAS